MIDTARVFPPVAPLPGSRKSSYLYMLLRPEFVRLNPVPLSSDAYSKFGKDGELEHNSEVLDATIRLEGQVVPEFARYLDQRYTDGHHDATDKTSGVDRTLFEEDSPTQALERNPHRKLEELSQLVAEMHLRGINVRYALAIHSLLTTSLISRLILTEVVARSAKHLIDDMWRGLDTVNEEVYRKETANFFTTLFSLDSDSAELWNSILAAEVDERFGLTLRMFRTPDMSLTVDTSTASTTTVQGFAPVLRVSGGSNKSLNSSTDSAHWTSPPNTNSTTTSPTNSVNPTSNAPPSLRTSNPRNQIRQNQVSPSMPYNASPFNSLNSDTSLNAVDGNLLRKGIDPTLLLFRICQLCGVELDFNSWNLPSPPTPETSLYNSFNMSSLSSNSVPSLLSSSSSMRQDPAIGPIFGAVLPPKSASNFMLNDEDESSGTEGSHEDSLASLWMKVDHFIGGASWSNSISSAVSLSPSETPLKKYFPVYSIKKIVARTKYLNRISYEEGTALSRLALSKTGQESFDLLSRANRKFHECLEIKPDDSKALLNWALVLTKQAELLETFGGSKAPQGYQSISSSTSTASTLWKEAFSKYERALLLRPTDWRALTSWGTAISSYAARSKDGAPSSLYRQAIDKFDRALRLLPLPHFHTLYNAANARLKLARFLLEELKSSRTVRADKASSVNRECYDILSASIARFQEALEIEGTNVHAMHNLAVALATQARICANPLFSLSNNGPSDISLRSESTPQLPSQGSSAKIDTTERDRLYKAAYLIYQRAVHLMPTSTDIYYGWGNALFRHALARRETSNSSEDEELAFTTLCEAATRYQACISISEAAESGFSRDVFINFGNVLMLCAKLGSRLKIQFPTSVASCCACYLKLVEIPQIRDTEASSITQVLVTLKRYVPKEMSIPATSSIDSNQPLNGSGSLQSQEEEGNKKINGKKGSQKVNEKATEILSQLGAAVDSDGNASSGSGSTGNQLSGSGGGNYDQTPTNDTLSSSSYVEPKPGKKKRRGSTVIIDRGALGSSSIISPGKISSPASGSPVSTPNSSSTLSRKKSVKSINSEAHSSKSDNPHRKSTGTSNANATGSTLKLDLAKTESGALSPTSSPALTSSNGASPSSIHSSTSNANNAVISNPSSPTGQHNQTNVSNATIPESSDSISRATRQGTTSKLRQKLGSLFGIRKSTASSSSSINSGSQSPNSANSPPPLSSSSSTNPTPIIRPDATSTPPKSTENTNKPSLSASTTQVPAVGKVRSKLKPARSLSYAEDTVGRQTRTNSTSSTIITSSAGSTSRGRDAEFEHSSTSTSSRLSGSLNEPNQVVSATPSSARSGKESLKVTDNSPITRGRRKSDADSRPPLRRELTAAGITTPREESKSPPSSLTRSSPQISRINTGSPKPHGGDYSSLNNETISQHAHPSGSSPPPSASSSSSSNLVTDKDREMSGVLKGAVGSSVSLTASGGAPRGVVEAPQSQDGFKSSDDNISSSKKDERKSKSKLLSKKEKTSSPSTKSHQRDSTTSSTGASLSSTSSKRKSGSLRSRNRKSVGKTSQGGNEIQTQTSPPAPTLPTQLDWSKSVLFAWDGALEIKESEFMVRGVLGTSRAGLVFAARKGEIDFAMKVRHPDSWERTSKPKLTPMLDHPFFVRPRHIFVSDSKLILTWSLVRGPQLLDYVDHISRAAKAKMQQQQQQSTQPQNMQPSAKTSVVQNQPQIEFARLDHLVMSLVAAQLVSAFSYLAETIKMPYRDFKPSNVLINDSGNVILTTHTEEDQSTLAYARADVSFLSPEIVIKIRERRALASALGKGNKAVEIVDDSANRVEDERGMWWTLGMYLLVLATGTNPLHSEDPMKVEENVLRKKFSIPQHLGKFSSLLTGLLDRDITARLCTTEQVRKHPYFHNMDWKKLTALGYHPPFLPNISAQTQSAGRSVLTDSRSLSTTNKNSTASLNSSSLDTSLDLSSTMGAQIALMNTMVMPDVGNQLEGNSMFIQNTDLAENDLCASSSASESDSS